MTMDLATAIFIGGIGQLLTLIASSLVPVRLQWKEILAPLPPLMQQLFWVYGGYVVLSIVSLGLICTFNAPELAAGSGLARCFCAYVAIFWGVRLSLQPFLNAGPFLTTWWLLGGYHLLSVMFACLTLLFIWATVH